MYRLFIFLISLLGIIENIASKYVPSENCGDPLILTPLIKKGEINLAREKSYVEPLLPNIFSHSGYLTVNETHKSNLFFWFFKQSSSEWLSRPVVLWLQGGPGCSSIFGLFTENGPFQVNKDGELVKNKYSWTNNYNVLYIDNPIGAGYSFTNEYYVSNEEEVGHHLFDALTQFFTLFPELQGNEFIISGESYAGKYIPALGYEIYKRNPKTSHPINLKGLFIGNGFSDPENMLVYAEHLHRLGLLDHREKLILQRKEEESRIFIRNAQWNNASHTFDTVWNQILTFTNFTSLYDYISEKFDGGDTYIEFMNDDNFRKTIHVGRTKYHDCSSKVHRHLLHDQFQSIKMQIEELLEVYPIMFFSGQLDIIVAHYLTSNFIDQLHWSGADGYSEAERNLWYVHDHLAGYYKSFGNLQEVLIRNAGHMVPAKHPLFLLDLLNRFVNGKL